MELENSGHRGRSTAILNGLPVQERPAELPGGEMPGPSGNEDGDAGTLTSLEYTGHRGHSGGWKPPPPTVHPMQHTGPLEGTEQQSLCHNSVRQGSGAEEATASGGGAEGYLREVLQGIQEAAGECNGVSIPGMGVDSGRR